MILNALFINTLRPIQNYRHFADDTLKRIFVNENVRTSIKISLKCVPLGPINNIPSLVQIMAWRHPGDKPLSEPIMVSILTDICVTGPQWVKSGCWHCLHRSWQNFSLLAFHNMYPHFLLSRSKYNSLPKSMSDNGSHCCGKWYMCTVLRIIIYPYHVFPQHEL